MNILACFYVFLSVLIIQKTNGITSPLTPFTNYQYSTELEPDIADLWWTVDEVKQEITFELHINTTGWISLGISPAGGMTGADIGLGWVDSTGQVHFQDRYATGYSRPLLDSTTTDWFAINGREENGWTAIQFKRFLDTCDKMDVPIKSGTNILIFAYDRVDPDMSQPGGLIGYHEDRRGSRIIPLRSYGNPSAEETFNGLDYFEFKLKDYIVPATDTTYHCKVFKAPTNYPQRRHALAQKTLIDPNNRDLVHHLLMHECNPTVVFDDSNLPDGTCDNIQRDITGCFTNIAAGWAVGGDDIVDFPEVAGYPVGGDFEIKYYMIQIHYDNPKLTPNRRDSSGIRFYLGNKLRQYDLGYLTLSAYPIASGIVIPPKTDRFIIDAYCPAEATKNFPESGLTVISAFPHTHLQGISLWTKIIRNKKAVEYLFNAEAYDFNYQFQNFLPNPIKLYPGDELATRCVYRTRNKSQLTLGGERTKDEMCMHVFMYYPRMNNLYDCSTINAPEAWLQLMNSTSSASNSPLLEEWLLGLNWTSELIAKWQTFFNNAPRVVSFGYANNINYRILDKLPEYDDLKQPDCNGKIPSSTIIPNCSPILYVFLSLFVIIKSY